MVSAIDLHMHSTASDGKDSPAALLEKVRALGIRCFSLTDHDTIDGAREVEALLAGEKEPGVKFIRGIECSCFTSVRKCHILGYGYDWDAPAFQAMMEKAAGLRRRKLEQRLDFLRRTFQIEFPAEEVAAMRRMGSVGKPHLAELMVKMGRAADQADAIQNYINRCPSMNLRMPAPETIRAIRAAGGVAVWAHPYGGRGEEPLPEEMFQAQLDALREAGIQGLECYYSQYSMERAASLKARAEASGLCVTGGSDCHSRDGGPTLGMLNADGVAVEQGWLSGEALGL